jgi:hypothetical protein
VELLTLRQNHLLRHFLREDARTFGRGGDLTSHPSLRTSPLSTDAADPARTERIGLLQLGVNPPQGS